MNSQLVHGPKNKRIKDVNVGTSLNGSVGKYWKTFCAMSDSFCALSNNEKN